MKYADCLVKYAVGRPLGSDIPLGEALQNLRHPNERVRSSSASWIGNHFGKLGMPHSEKFFTDAGVATHDMANMPKGVNSKVSVDTEVPGEARVWLSHRIAPGDKTAVSTFRDLKSPEELHSVLSGFAEEGHIDPRHVPMHVERAFPRGPQAQPTPATTGPRGSRLAKTDPNGKPAD